MVQGILDLIKAGSGVCFFMLRPSGPSLNGGNNNYHNSRKDAFLPVRSRVKY